MLYHYSFSIFALEYIIRDVQENKERLEPNVTHQHPLHADDVNLSGENINIITKTQSPFDANKIVGLDVNMEKTK
jgi:hypothetical protein